MNFLFFLKYAHRHFFLESLDIIQFELQVKILVELMYQLMPPLETTDHAELVIAKKNVIIGQETYINQLASVAILIVQVRVPSLITKGGACIFCLHFSVPEYRLQNLLHYHQFATTVLLSSATLLN